MNNLLVYVSLAVSVIALIVSAGSAGTQKFGFAASCSGSPVQNCTSFNNLIDDSERILGPTATVAGLQSSTPVLFLGPNAINTAGASASGTWIGINVSSSINADLVDFQINSSTQFKVASSGAVSVGAGTQNNTVNLWVVASTTFLNGSTNGVILGAFGVPSSTTSTVAQIVSGISANVLSVGDPCFASINATSVAFQLFTSCMISSVATTTASATITYANASTSAATVPTSTITRIEIHHLPF